MFAKMPGAFPEEVLHSGRLVNATSLKNIEYCLIALIINQILLKLANLIRIIVDRLQV
jgi:hypothetical protein